MAALPTGPSVPLVGLRLPGPDSSLGGVAAFEAMAAIATAAERCGFDALWIDDHSVTGPEVVPDPVASLAEGKGTVDSHRTSLVTSEPYSLLGALAVRTSSARLGVYSTALSLRAFSLVAKAVAAVDVISHGRAVAALGSETRHGEASERLAEGLALCRLLLSPSGGAVTYEGVHARVKGAPNLPRPVQDGGVPLMVTARGAGALAVAAASADAVVVEGGPPEVAAAVAAVRQASRAAERPTGVPAVLWAGSPIDRAASAQVTTTQLLSALVASGANGWIVTVPEPDETYLIQVAQDLQAALAAP